MRASHPIYKNGTVHWWYTSYNRWPRPRRFPFLPIHRTIHGPTSTRRIPCRTACNHPRCRHDPRRLPNQHSRKKTHVDHYRNPIGRDTCIRHSRNHTTPTRTPGLPMPFQLLRSLPMRALPTNYKWHMQR